MIGEGVEKGELTSVWSTFSEVQFCLFAQKQVADYVNPKSRHELLSMVYPQLSLLHLMSPLLVAVGLLEEFRHPLNLAARSQRDEPENPWTESPHILGSGLM